MRPIVASLALALSLLPVLAPAQESGLISLETTDSGKGWEAVGRLASTLEAWRMICWRVVMLQLKGEVPSWEASMAQLYRKDFNPQFGRLLLEVLEALLNLQLLHQTIK